jgi:hypothetical protein
MIKTYIVTWNNVVSGLDDITNQIDNYEVINSDAPEKDGWHNLGLIWYYNQFKYAIDHFINNTQDETFCFITGDISSNHFSDIYNKAQLLLSDDNVWLYSPHLSNEPWTKNVCFIEDYSKNSYISCQTEGIFFFMKRELAIKMKDFMDTLSNSLDLSSMKSGWGVDYVWCTIAKINNKLALRDDEYFIHHPQGSSYDHTVAKKEMSMIVRHFLHTLPDADIGIALDNIKYINDRMASDQHL